MYDIDVFSEILETAGGDDARAINAGLAGIVQSIRAGVLGMGIAREAFAVSLSKLISLDAPSTSSVVGMRELRSKNVACDCALLNNALNEGDRLGHALGPVLVVISLLVV